MSDVIQTGKSIDYPTMKKGLQELNRSIVFDDGCGQVIYMMNEGRMRAGIYFHNRYLSAVERTLMPEFSVYDGYDNFEVPCTRDEFFVSPKDDLTHYVQEIVVDEKTDPMRHMILSSFIGLDGSKTLKNGRGGETIVVRFPNGDIVISTPMKIVRLPSQVIQIGWREVFERLLQANIPGVSKESLGKKFGVDMTSAFQHDLQLAMATNGLPTIAR
jgi:hypothetical protein